MTKALVLALLVACTPVQRRVALTVSSTALLVADYEQTKSIVQRCGETNPVIGQCGERVSPGPYFATAIIINLALAGTLPGALGDVWLAGLTGAQASTVWGNHRRK